MINNYRLPKLKLRRLGLALMLPVALYGAVVFPTQLQTATAQTSSDNRPLSIRADVQEYNSKSEVFTARGNVQVLYPARQIQATAAQAQYLNRERRINLNGGVSILEKGINSIRGENASYLMDDGRFIVTPKSGSQVISTYAVDNNNTNARNQASTNNQPLTIRADLQEYNSNTEVASGRGNVQLSYPSGQIKATAAQAQFFNRERRIILSGNVYILQEGRNSIRGETVTYLIDEGRFVATPKSGGQVESIYILDDANGNTQPSKAPSTPNLRRSN
ncbi:LptA/OstA family protein [Plectonema radiosum]|nr:LptA/OstA family protein [Plectonema radiosum]